MIPKVPEGSLAQRHKGDFFEGLVGKYLKEKGFILLEQNYQTREGEIDWIVQDGETLVFIEVKMRRVRNMAVQAEAVDRESGSGSFWRLYPIWTAIPGNGLPFRCGCPRG
ncbi:MAG: YraN family protein [Candidatus Omnitrophica bacterium]|nr:YraN family protein [Candidatus Omnitrophota bacterium]